MTHVLQFRYQQSNPGTNPLISKRWLLLRKNRPASSQYQGKPAAWSAITGRSTRPTRLQAN